MSGSISFDTTGFLARRRKLVHREITWAGRNIQRDVVYRMRSGGKTGRAYMSRGSKLTRVFAVANRKTRQEYFVGADGKKVRKNKFILDLFGRHYSGRLHRASAPGQAPAVDIGVLATHVAYAVREAGLMLTASMGISSGRGGNEALLIVAKSLETGAKFSGRRGGIDPRPAWNPALRVEAVQFRRRLFEALRQQVRKG